MKKVEISRILLQVGKKEIKLSLEEARELQQILADMLGIEKHNRITVIPNAPVIIPYYPRKYSWWEITEGIGGYDNTDSTKEYVITCSNQLGVSNEQ